MTEEVDIITPEDGELRLRGRGVSKGKVEGSVLKSLTPLPLSKGVNLTTSKVEDESSDINDEPIKERVLVFPHIKTAQQYPNTLSSLKENNMTPLALISETLGESVIKDAQVAEIPALDGVDISLLEHGDDVLVKGTSGFVVLKNVVLKKVASAVILSQGKVLILKRSDDVGTYQGRWACVSGYVEKGETPDKTALREISEEVGLERDEFTFVRKGKVIYARDKTILWAVHPFLFETKEADITLDREHIDYMWIYPEEVGSYDTVPKLDETLKNVLLNDKV